MVSRRWIDNNINSSGHMGCRTFCNNKKRKLKKNNDRRIKEKVYKLFGIFKNTNTIKEEKIKSRYYGIKSPRRKTPFSGFLASDVPKWNDYPLLELRARASIITREHARARVVIQFRQRRWL